MAETAPALTTPARHFGLGRHLALASFWFGMFFLWGPLYALVIPYQVDRLLPRDQQGIGIGVLIAIGAVFAATVPPLVGRWSDQMSTPWGRRRPIMAVGTILNVAGLVVMMVAPDYAALVLGLVVVQISNNSAGAAFNGIVPDVVPRGEVGRASGLLGAMVQLGSITGAVAWLLLPKFGSPPLGIYLVIGVVLALSLLPTLWASSGEGQAPPVRQARLTGMDAMREFLSPLRAHDFAWVILTRTLITAGIYAILPFIHNFFRDVVGVDDPDQFTPIWIVVLLLFATPPGAAGGWISDRIGRKLFVYGSGALMSLVVMVFIVVFKGSPGLALILGAAFGVGYGLYYAVDWALACDTLPDPDRPAKDMGLFHVALTLPQAIVPALGGLALDTLNRSTPGLGYRVVFTSSILFFLAGTIFVSRIRSVR